MNPKDVYHHHSSSPDRRVIRFLVEDSYVALKGRCGINKRMTFVETRPPGWAVVGLAWRAFDPMVDQMRVITTPNPREMGP